MSNYQYRKMQLNGPRDEPLRFSGMDYIITRHSQEEIFFA